MQKITINSIPLEVEEGTTILQAAKNVNITIPTLCYLEGLRSIGACRVCLVEVKGMKTLVASCVTEAREGMVILTDSPRVRKARRSVVGLLLSDHAGDCRTCDRNTDCELQKLAVELGIKEISYQGDVHRGTIDASTPALVRDTTKCINCRRCVTVCEEVQGVAALFPQNRGFNTIIGPAFGKTLDSVACVQCGQCAAVCPVGAITEKDQVDEVWKALDDPVKMVVVQTAPAIRAALGECFGNEPGTSVTGKMITALRRLGFDYVFDTEFTADLTIMEEGTELLHRLTEVYKNKNDAALPQFTSCCPAWIKYAEYYYPELLPNISSCKSPQQMFGAAAKTYFSKKIAKHPEDIVVVSIMPCTAKKFEAQREEMHASWSRDVDIVLTTRELGKMIKQAGIDFNTLEGGSMDAPLGMSTGAADMFAISGGVMEAALRTAYEIVTGKAFPFPDLRVEPIIGLAGVKEAAIPIETDIPEWSFLNGVTLKVAVAHSLSCAKQVIERVKSGRAEYHFIEVMACPGGCIGGGGQPRLTTDRVRIARSKVIIEEDKSRAIRKSHENPDIGNIYKEFFGKPLSEKSHTFLHTHYTPRPWV